MSVFEAIVADYLLAVKTIETGPYVLREAEDRRLRAEAEVDFKRRYGAAIDAACMAAIEPIDRAIADAERSARSATSTDIELRCARLVRQASDAGDATGIRRAVDEALVVGHVDTIYSVLESAANRYRALTSGSNTPEALRQARTKFELESMQWRKEHPTTTEQIAKLRADRERAVVDVEREAQHVRQTLLPRDRAQVIRERHAQIKL